MNINELENKKQFKCFWVSVKAEMFTNERKKNSKPIFQTKIVFDL